MYEIQIRYLEDTVSMQISRGQKAMILIQIDVFGHKECRRLTMKIIQTLSDSVLCFNYVF